MKTPQEDCKNSHHLVFDILYSIIGLVILVGNGFAAIVFLRTQNLRRQYMNIFLVSLAISDMLMATLVAPLFATYCSIDCSVSHGPAKYCWLMRKIKDMVLIGNMFNLFAITYDRHLAVMHSLQYMRKMTCKRVSLILAAVWFIPGVFAGIRNAWQHTTSSKDQIQRFNRIYNSIIIIVVIIIPICLMTLVNVRIVKAIKRQSRRIRDATFRTGVASTLETETRTDGTRLRRNKGTMACALVVFIFVVCWLPRCLYIMSYIFGMVEGDGLSSPILFKVSFTFLFLQSSFNPFIYSFYRSDFRRAALRLIKRH